jgi:phosphate transport system substrate-binding protein
MPPLKPILLVGFVVSLSIVTGCDSSAPTSVPTAGDASAGSSLPAAATPTESTLVGDININGSSTVQPISNAIREAFIKVHPGVNVTVGGEGTGNGFKEFAHKSTDISDASRPIKPGELAACKEGGVEFVELPVAYDGLTIVVHPENDWAKSLTVDQLKKIFVGEDAAKTWKDVDPSWPDDAIKIFAPGTGSGTYDYFHEVVAKKDKKELRGDMNLNEDDNILVQGVAGNKYSIGFFGVAYYAQNADILKAIPIVNPKTGDAVLPTTENIATNKYAPFSRPLFIYVNTESLNRAEVQTFVQFFLDNVSGFCESGKVDYVQLPEDVFGRTNENFDSVAPGTHFVDADGNSRSGPFSELFKAENLTN